jgi:hypothetical protein
LENSKKIEKLRCSLSYGGFENCTYKKFGYVGLVFLQFLESEVDSWLFLNHCILKLWILSIVIESFYGMEI